MQSSQGDAYPPAEIARRIEQLGVAKAHSDTPTLLVLSILAGAFISLGALFYIVVVTDSGLGFGVTRLLGGLSFCLGLILVVVAGAELFTGNNLIAMAWASGLIGFREVLRNWVIVYLGNIIGCLGTVLLVLLAGVTNLHDGAIEKTIISIAQGKINLSPIEAFTRGILCNVCVCLAVWLSIGARSVSGKILAILFPITAFVAMGFEHSIANWFFLPLAIGLSIDPTITITAALENILIVSIGNIVGGTLLVAGVYWFAYLRTERVKNN
ncbi:MAG: formate transporter [Parasphingorhabdus sp.]|jgi:formate transporter